MADLARHSGVLRRAGWRRLARPEKRARLSGAFPRPSRREDRPRHPTARGL